MHLVAWNIRGLNEPIKQVAIKRFLLSNNVSLMFILETRVKIFNSRKIMKAIRPGWSWMHNYSKAYNGRIWLAWNHEELIVNVFRIEEQLVHCEVSTISGDISFACTIVYAQNTSGQRERLWEALVNLNSQMTKPWLILGDFNTVLFYEERVKCGGYMGDDTIELQALVAKTGLKDLQYTGHALTWCNKQEGRKRLYSKLNRAMISNTWMSVFPMPGAVFLDSYPSDHSPFLVTVGKQQLKPKPFKFCNMWTENPEFTQLVKDAWDMNVRGCPMFVVVKKMKAVKLTLKQLRRQHYSNLTTRIDEVAAELKEVQSRLQATPFDEILIQQEEEVGRKLQMLERANLSLSAQKAKVQWMKEMDCNTSYFHARVKEKWHRSKIITIMNSQGQLLTEQNEVQQEFVSF